MGIARARVLKYGGLNTLPLVRWLTLLSLLVNAIGLVTPIINAGDSVTYAALSQHMVRHGDWVNLVLDGQDWLDKPHFPFWVTALFFKLGGVNAISYNLPGFLFHLLGAYYTYRIADNHYLGMTRATVIKKYVLPKIQAKGPAPAVIYQRLYQLGLGDIAADELQYLLISDSANQAQESFDLAWLYDKMGLHSKSISTIARRYPVKILGFRSMPRSVLQLLFPSAFWDTVKKYATQFDLDPYFGMSIMRAESMFKDQVRSRSGAVGLMQIMPATGKGIAERLGVTWKDVPTLLDIDTNIRFGIYYLSTLDTRFNGNLTLMSSGYNAGPNITRKWANDMGFDDIDMFVLNLPKLETENYVYKVLGNYWMYRILYPAAGK